MFEPGAEYCTAGYLLFLKQQRTGTSFRMVYSQRGKNAGSDRFQLANHGRFDTRSRWRTRPALVDVHLHQCAAVLERRCHHERQRLHKRTGESHSGQSLGEDQAGESGKRWRHCIYDRLRSRCNTGRRLFIRQFCLQYQW